MVMVGLTVLMYFQQFEDPKFQYIFQGEHIPKTLMSLELAWPATPTLII